MEIKPNELKEGEKATIKHWVNQPDYIGNTLSRINGELIMTSKNGFETKYIDMRFPHFCRIEIIKQDTQT